MKCSCCEVSSKKCLVCLGNNKMSDMLDWMYNKYGFGDKLFKMFVKKKECTIFVSCGD